MLTRLKSLSNTYIPYVHIGIILLLGIASYANSLDVPMQFDDGRTIFSSIDISSDLYSIQSFIHKSRWVADVTFALNYHLHGEQLLGYHLLNLAIHLASAGVVYLLVQLVIEALKRTFRIAEDDENVTFLQHFIPFTAAALFVCHPVQTQAVTYIVQRYTSLATFLYLSSLLSYLLARLSFADDAKKRQVWSWGFTCFLSSLLAMKSKEIAFTLPLMIAALEAALFRGRLLKNRLYLALGAGLLLVIPLQLVYTHGTGSPGNLLNHIQAAATETEAISRADYLLTQFRVVATYLRLLILPINQNLDYDYPVYHSLFDPSVFAALLLHITLAGIAITLFIRSSWRLNSVTPSTGISMRLACLGIFWFYLALTVESSLIPINDVIFEHRIYLPSVGFFMSAAACIAGIAAHRQRYRNACWVATVLLCLAFTVSTIARNRIWSSEMALWQDVLEKSPNKARARYYVGMLYFKKYLPEKALPHLVRAVELEPGKQLYWNKLNAALSIIAKYKGRCSQGMEYHATLDKVDSVYVKPWLANSYNNLGLAYEHLGNLYLAQESYQKAVTFNPSLDLAWYNLALVAAHLNDTSTVATSLKRLRIINPLLEQDAAKMIREQQRSE